MRHFSLVLFLAVTMSFPSFALDKYHKDSRPKNLLPDTYVSFDTSGVTWGMATSSSLENEIEVQGHRGCRGVLPENTLPAFLEALLAGVHVLEMDVAVTKDRHLVLSHDPFINREICRHADGRAIESPLLINDLTLNEVKSFDCGSIRHPRFSQQRPVKETKIPTLSEVFELVRTSSHPHAQRIGFNIETKIFPDFPHYTVGPNEFAELIVRAFQESGFLDRITLQSFDPRTLIKARELAPSLRRVALVEDEHIDMVELGKRVDAYAVSPDFKLLSQKMVERLKMEGFKVIPWTINDKEGWLQAVRMKVDGIITDYPQDLMHYLSLFWEA